MGKVQIKIKGTSPLLFNRFNMPNENGDEIKKKDKQYDPKTEADRLNYFDEQIGCYMPSAQIEASMREAAKNFKQGKSNYKTVIMSCVFCETDKIPLNKQTYDEIDSRFARIQRQGIVKCRPRYNDWELSFNLLYDESRIKPHILKAILEEAGKIKAVGDYRPKFGRFQVLEFNEIN